MPWLWSVGRYDLGLGEEEFWQLTLGLFDLLFERWREGQARRDRRSGEIAALLYNLNRDLKKDPRGKTWMDFFPQAQRPRDASREEKASLHGFMMWAMAHNARLAAVKAKEEAKR